MSIVEAIHAAAQALALENVQPVRHQIVFDGDQYDSFLFEMNARSRRRAGTLVGGTEDLSIHTPYGKVEIIRAPRADIGDAVTLPLGEMRAAMRELEEIERDWSSAEDEHAAKVSMSTVRRCVALLRAAESVHVLSGGKSESLYTATGGDLEMIGHRCGIVRHVAATGSIQTMESDRELRARIIIALSPL